MTYATIQVSNHRESGLRIPTKAGGDAWETLYDGPIESAKEARRAVEELSAWFRCARVFLERDLGKLHYAVLR
jgi:hypothetical protein